MNFLLKSFERTIWGHKSRKRSSEFACNRKQETEAFYVKHRGRESYYLGELDHKFWCQYCSLRDFSLGSPQLRASIDFWFSEIHDGARAFFL